MKRASIFTVLLSLALCFPAGAQEWPKQQRLSGEPPTMSVEEAVAKVATYRVGDDRAAMMALEESVAEASASPESARRMEQRLIRALPGATPEGKDQICRHLMLIGSAAAVQAVAPMLNSAETADVARYALERIPGEEASQALREMLPKTSGSVQLGIVNTLGRRRDAGAVPALRRLIPGNDAEVAVAAAAALGQIADQTAADALAALRQSTSGELRLEVDRAYLRTAEGMAARGDRSAAFAVFKTLNASSEPEIIRIGAVRGLAIAGGSEAIPLLAEAIRTAEPAVQAQAIRHLSAIPGPAAREALSESFADLEDAGKVWILAALANRGEKAALPLLVNAATDDAEPVRVAALLGMGKIGDASSVRLLAETAARQASATEQPPGQDVAAERTGGFPNERGIAQASGLGDQEAARLSLSRLPGDDVDKAIIAGIASGDPAVRMELIQASSARGLTAATDALLTAATDSNREVRRAALRALRVTAGPANVPTLIGLLSKLPDAADRSEAVQSLSSALRRSDTASLDPVISAYQSASGADLRASLLAVLARVGNDESLPLLRGALKDANPDTRRGAVLALSEWPSTAPAPDLLELARNDPNQAVQVLSVRGYIRLAGLDEGVSPAEAVRMLSEAMDVATRADEKKAVLSALSRINSKEALALAEAAMKDPEVSSEAKMAADQIRQSLAGGRRRRRN